MGRRGDNLVVCGGLAKRSQLDEDEVERVAWENLRVVLWAQCFLYLVDLDGDARHAALVRRVVVGSLSLITATHTHFNCRQLHAVEHAVLWRNESGRETCDVLQRGAPIVLIDQPLEKRENGGVVAVVGVLDITETRERDRNALFPNGAVAVVTNGEQIHHAVHLVERSVERRARHAPHVDATQLRTARKKTRRVFDEVHFVQHEAPPLHAKQRRDEGGEGGGTSQLPLLRHEDVVVLLETVIACEDDVELRQILGEEKEGQARGF